MFVDQESDMFQNDSRSSCTADSNAFVEERNCSVLANSNNADHGAVDNVVLNSHETLMEKKSKKSEKRSVMVENEGLSRSLAKKQDHNAKERVRRMKLHATYIALGSLLPQCPTSKVIVHS